MSHWNDFLNNDVLWTAVLAWFIAQTLKCILVYFNNKKIDFTKLVASGGMPSSHSSFCVSLATSVGFVDGFSSSLFAVCVCFAIVVMYDAAGVRRSAGQQAKILNTLVERRESKSHNDTDAKLKELIGHTPVEVLAGAVLGAIIAIIRYL